MFIHTWSCLSCNWLDTPVVATHLHELALHLCSVMHVHIYAVKGTYIGRFYICSGTCTYVNMLVHSTYVQS